jgi:hypothetical protein
MTPTIEDHGLGERYDVPGRSMGSSWSPSLDG